MTTESNLAAIVKQKVARELDILNYDYGYDEKCDDNEVLVGFAYKYTKDSTMELARWVNVDSYDYSNQEVKSVSCLAPQALRYTINRILESGGRVFFDVDR